MIYCRKNQENALYVGGAGFRRLKMKKALGN